jgi:hypothetical protein
MGKSRELYENMEGKPIHKYKNLWWFYDECWSYRIGPFESRILAEMALRNYVRQLNARDEEDFLR